MHARMGYRNKGDKDGDWKELDTSLVHRNLDCDIDDDKRREGYYYNCSMLNLFELGSLHHDFYLLNVRLPALIDDDSGKAIEINSGIGKLVDLSLIAIHQNGGFTKVWVALKTVFFPVIVLEMAWFWRRIHQLPRDSTLLEKTLFCLGCALTFLNLPLEYFTLYLDMPWLTLFNDIKQVIVDQNSFKTKYIRLGLFILSCASVLGNLLRDANDLLANLLRGTLPE